MNEAVLSLAAAKEAVGSPSLLSSPPGILEFIPGAIYACDAAGRILWFNRKAVDLWGRAPSIGDDTELFCGSYKWLLNDRQIKREDTPMAFVLKAGAAVHGVDGTIERPDGSQIAAVVHIEPVKDAAGKVIGAIGCIYDISHRRRAMSDLARARAVLDAGQQNSAGAESALRRDLRARDDRHSGGRCARPPPPRQRGCLFDHRSVTHGADRRECLQCPAFRRPRRRPRSIPAARRRRDRSICDREAHRPTGRQRDLGRR